MTLRITIREEGSRGRLEVAGRLTVEEVGELEQAIASTPDGYVDLGDLRSVDATGLAALRRLKAEGVQLCAVPPHLVWRLEGDEGGADDGSPP